MTKPRGWLWQVEPLAYWTKRWQDDAAREGWCLVDADSVVTITRIHDPKAVERTYRTAAAKLRPQLYDAYTGERAAPRPLTFIRWCELAAFDDRHVLQDAARKFIV